MKTSTCVHEMICKTYILSKQAELQVCLHLYTNISYQCHHVQYIFGGFIFPFIATQMKNCYNKCDYVPVSEQILSR